MDQNGLPTSSSLTAASVGQHEPAAAGSEGNSAMSIMKPEPEDKSSDVADTSTHRRTTSQIQSHGADRRNHAAGTTGNGPARLSQSSKQDSSQVRSSQQSPVSDQLTSFLGLVHRMISSGREASQSGSISQRDEQARKEREHLIESLERKDRQIAKMKVDHEKNLKNIENDFRRIKEEDRQQFNHALQDHHDQWQHEHRRTVSNLQTQLQETQREKDALQMEHDAFIRGKQEASFRNMEPGRWAPTEESKIIGQLDRLRREMRTWAKGMAVKDMSLLETLDKKDLKSLMDYLSNVVALQDDQLPAGLATPKSPALLLNALLTHTLYSSLFRSPFFFLEEIYEDSLENIDIAGGLEQIYEMAQKCKFGAHERHRNFLALADKNT